MTIDEALKIAEDAKPSYCEAHIHVEALQALAFAYRELKAKFDLGGYEQAVARAIKVESSLARAVENKINILKHFLQRAQKDAEALARAKEEIHKTNEIALDYARQRDEARARIKELEAVQDAYDKSDKIFRVENINLRNKLNDSVPRSRYDKCNQDWLDAQSKINENGIIAAAALQSTLEKIEKLKAMILKKDFALKLWARCFKGVPHCGCGVDEPTDICSIHQAVEEALALKETT